MQQNPTSPILRSLWFTILSIVALYFASTLLLHLMLSPLGAVSDPTFWNFVIYVASFGITIGYALFLSRHQGLDFPSFHPSKWIASPRLIAAGVILIFATGILLTPLQAAVYTAALANGGKIMKPYLAASLVNQQGGVLYTWKGRSSLRRLRDRRWKKRALMRLLPQC